MTAPVPILEQVGLSPFSVFVTASHAGFTAFVSYRRDGSINVVRLIPDPESGQRSTVFPTFGDALAGQPCKAMRDLLRATVGPAIEAGLTIQKDFWEFLDKPLDA